MLKGKLISMVLFISIGSSIGFMSYNLFINDMNNRYMTMKFEYLNENNIEDFKSECRRLNINCDIYSFKKEDNVNIEVYLGDKKLTKVIGEK